MRWFKHLTESHNDPDISDAWDAFGDAAVVVFWVTLEIYTHEFSHLDEDMFLTLSVKFWERSLRRKWKKIQKIWDFFQEKSRFFYEISEKSSENGEATSEKKSKKNLEFVKIRIPKAIELIDEYTRKHPDNVRTLSGATPKKIRSDAGIELEYRYRIKNKDKNSLSPSSLSHSNQSDQSGILEGESERKNKSQNIIHENIDYGIGSEYPDISSVAKGESDQSGYGLPAVHDDLQPGAINREGLRDNAREGGFIASFEKFWNKYPKKRNKNEAWIEWRKLNPSENLQRNILESIEVANQSRSWQTEGGRWIPLPARWLSAHGWEDEYQQTTGLDSMPDIKKGKNGYENEEFLIKKYNLYLETNIPLTRDEIISSPKLDEMDRALLDGEFSKHWLAKFEKHIRLQMVDELGLMNFEEFKTNFISIHPPPDSG